MATSGLPVPPAPRHRARLKRHGDGMRWLQAPYLNLPAEGVGGGASPDNGRNVRLAPPVTARFTSRTAADSGENASGRILASVAQGCLGVRRDETDKWCQRYVTTRVGGRPREKSLSSKVTARELQVGT
jgi:hypothetical protein